MSGTKELKPIGVSIVVSRMGRRGYRAMCYITNSDKTEATLTKEWPDKTIGYVETELNKFKQGYIRQGVPATSITVNYTK